MIGTGTTLSMIWDIAIQAMDPKIVKQLKPGAFGLTSRWLDRDTGEMTLFGNTRMNSGQRTLLRRTRAWENASKVDTATKVSKAEAQASKPKSKKKA